MTARVYTGRHRSTTEKFIAKASKVHNGKYNYDKVKYTFSNVKVTITCPVHGDWDQTPNHHLAGKGCTACSNIDKINGYSKEHKDNPYYVYKILLSSSDESFIKIGITKDPNRRFSEFRGYSVTPLYVLFGTLSDCAKHEQFLHKRLKSKRYIPVKKFKGCTECFRPF